MDSLEVFVLKQPVEELQQDGFLSDNCTECELGSIPGINEKCVIKCIQNPSTAGSLQKLSRLAQCGIAVPILGLAAPEQTNSPSHVILKHCNIANLADFIMDMARPALYPAICEQLIEKVQRLHGEQRAVHGNLHPEHVLLHKEQGNRLVYLTGFLFMKSEGAQEDILQLQQEDLINCVRIVCWFHKCHVLRQDVQYEDSFLIMTIEDLRDFLNTGYNGRDFGPQKRLLEDLLHQAGRFKEQQGQRPLQGEEDESHSTEDERGGVVSHKALLKVIRGLGLSDYYPQKLSMQEVHRMAQEDGDSLVWNMLYRLISQDLLCQRQAVTSHNNAAPADRKVHPLDVLVAVFHCADDFLRVTLTEKLFLCKLSIPLVLPRPPRPGSPQAQMEVLQLPFRDIIVEDQWGRERAIMEQPATVLSFARIGDTDFSKSALLNQILDSQKAFSSRDDYDEDTPASSVSRGVIDMAWRLPSRRPDAEAEEAGAGTKITAMLNLHGSASEHEEQWGFLLAVSHRMVLVVDVDQLLDGGRRQKTLALLDDVGRRRGVQAILVISRTVDGDGGERQFKEAVGCLSPEAWPQKRVFKWTVRFRECLKWLDSVSPGDAEERQVSELCQRQATRAPEAWSLDEGKDPCREARAKAQAVLEVVGRYESVAAFKEAELPFQGKEWRMWVTLNKQELRGRVREARELEQNRRKMDEILEERTKSAIYGDFPDFLTQIFAVLMDGSGCGGGLALKRYFLFWLKLGLDRFSRRDIPRLRERHNRLWERLEAAKGTSRGDTSAEEQQRLEADFRRADQDIANASMGIEHVLREFGHIYEAMSQSQAASRGHAGAFFRSLPLVMAELVERADQPMEMMDGDASSVPKNWLTAVLHALERSFGVRSLLVLSVLGLQSSGKSTLLNAKFGLKFPVSAGRCTRGVYAQLIPAPVALRLPFSHILVVDTEGLRAPELESMDQSREHDHEIATYVLGMGNVTIVNIKGENMKGGMDEILEIVMYAFLRMIKVNQSISLQPKCVFVHQNVSAANARDKMQTNNQALLQSLHRSTKLVAEKLDLLDKYSRFTDLVTFDIERHALYFNEYLKGTPPAAPVNEGYAANVLGLKRLLLAEEARRGEFVTPAEYAIKLSELAEGVLREDFIFSFRNAIEVRAYGSLEEVTTELVWRLHRLALELTLKGKQFIEAQPSDELDSAEARWKEELSQQLAKCLQAVLADLRSHVSASPDRAVLEKFSLQTRAKIEAEAGEKRREGAQALEQASQARRNFLTRDDKVEQQRDRLQAEAIRLAKALKGKDEGVSREQLDKCFEDTWRTFLAKIPEARVDMDCLSRMKELIRAEYGAFHDIQLNPLWDATSGEDMPAFVEPASAPSPGFNLLGGMGGRKKDADLLKARHRELEKWSKDSLEAVRVSPVLEPEMRGWLQHICQRLDKEKHIRQIVPLAKYMASRLQKRYVAHVRDNDLRNHFNVHHKEDLRKVFKDVYYTKESEVGINLIGTKLAGFAEKRNRDTLLQELLTHLKKEKEFRLKHELQLSALRHLVNASFEEVTAYLESTDIALQKHMRVLQDVLLFRDSHAYHDIASNVMYSGFTAVIDAVNSTPVLAPATGDKVSIGDWLSALHQELNKRELFCSMDMLDYTKCGINSNVQPDKVKQEMVNLLSSRRSEKEAEAKSTQQLDEESKMYLLRQFEGTAIGCTEQCPFCSAMCMRSEDRHESKHVCVLHYPQGMSQLLEEESKRLIIYNCQEQVASKRRFRNENTNGKLHAYRAYDSLYSDWYIPPEREGDPKSLLWKHIFAKYNKDFAENFGAEPAEIPDEWKNITADSVFQNLDHEVTKRANSNADK